MQFSRFLLEPRMFSHEFQSVWALMDIVLIQTRKFFHEYSHGDLTAKVLAVEHFVLYGIVLCLCIIIINMPNFASIITM